MNILLLLSISKGKSMLSCYCNIKESKNNGWICKISAMPWECPHNLLNKDKTFFRNRKTAQYLRKHYIATGVILLFTPFFPLSIYFFISAASIKWSKRNALRRVP